MTTLEASSNERRAGAAETISEQLLVEELVSSESEGDNVRSVDIQAIARRVQRANRTLSAETAATISGEQEEKLALAAVHLWRAKMHVRLSNLYSEKAWDSKKFPRKFYLKYRGFRPTHQRSDLVEFRKLYLRCALSSSERAVELAPFSYECVMLKACILCLLISFGGYMRDIYCEKALTSCRRAMSLHRMPQIADNRERAILYNSTQDRTSAQATESRRSDARMASLWNMAIFAAHTVATKRGSWDADTLWADRQNSLGSGTSCELPSGDLPTSSLEELVSWNMWGNNWTGLGENSTLQDVLADCKE